MAGKTAPYGTWESPITSDALTKKSITIEQVLVDPTTGGIYHVESRPSEQGRAVVVNSRTKKDVVGRKWNVRTRVHEYGGGAAIVYAGVLYFSGLPEGRVYMLKLADAGEPVPITPLNPQHRFADFAVCPVEDAQSWLVAILEDHTKPAPTDVVNTLCVIDPQTSTVHPLLSGADFYSSPRFSPDGTQLAWLQWNHPDMPWEGSELYVANIRFAAGVVTLGAPQHVAGEAHAVSVGYPFWADSGALFFLSDAGAGFQNPWIRPPAAPARPLLAAPLAHEFGMPQWKLGRPYGAPLGAHAVFCATADGRDVLHAVDVASGAHTPLACPYVEMHSVQRAGAAQFVFAGKTADAEQAVVLCSIPDTDAAPTYETLVATGDAMPADMIARARPISFGVPGGGTCHAVLYPPTNGAYAGSSIPGSRPPCIVRAHGGPTELAQQGLAVAKQFWTSRGWAWLDVNYGGSSGYGRQYMERLAGQWGLVDAEDCILAARTLASPPYDLIDLRRLVIRGGSAGGYTVLQALTHPDPAKAGLWAAGTSTFGISDLRTLTTDTHKFESRYMEKLIGGTIAEIPDVYADRSPVTHADRIKAPILILQGSLDAAVPPAQSESIVKTVKERGGDIEYVLYEGEGHGWRKAETIKDAFEKELQFYERILGLKG